MTRISRRTPTRLHHEPHAPQCRDVAVGSPSTATRSRTALLTSPIPVLHVQDARSDEVALFSAATGSCHSSPSAELAGVVAVGEDAGIAAVPMVTPDAARS